MRISDWSSDVCSSDLLVVDHHLDLAKAGLCHWEILRNLGAEIYYEDLRETRIVGNNGMEVCGLRLVAQLCWDEVFFAGALFDICVSLDRKSVGLGTMESVRVDLGGGRLIKKKKQTNKD